MERKERQKICPPCGHTHLVKNGYRIRDLVGLPIGGKKTIIRMKVQRYKCMNERCSYDQQERIPFATGSCSYTHRLARYVTDLLKAMILKDVSGLMDVSWATIKDIHVRYLERHYSPPRRGTVYPGSPKWKRMKVRIRRSGISRPDNKSPIYIIRWSISPLYIIRYGNR